MGSLVQAQPEARTRSSTCENFRECFFLFIALFHPFCLHLFFLPPGKYRRKNFAHTVFFITLLAETTHYDETFPSHRQHRSGRCVGMRRMRALAFPPEGKRQYGNTYTRHLPPTRKGSPRKDTWLGAGRLSAEHPDPERLAVLPVRPAKPYRHELHRVQSRLHRIHLALAIFQLSTKHGG